MDVIQAPPKLVYDATGQLVEVIVSADDFRAFVRTLAKDADWEALPLHLQDAFDRLLIDEVRAEKPTALDLEGLLAGTQAR